MAKLRRALKISVGLSFALIALSPAAFAVSAVQVTNFGANPTGIGMYLYTPSNVVAKPPILVGIHACHGKGLDVCSSGNPFAQQASRAARYAWSRGPARTRHAPLDSLRRAKST